MRENTMRKAIRVTRERSDGIVKSDGEFVHVEFPPDVGPTEFGVEDLLQDDRFYLDLDTFKNPGVVVRCHRGW